MAYRLRLIALAAILCFSVTGIYFFTSVFETELQLFIIGTSAIKCTHCAYVNDGECHSVVCDGAWCAIQATVDTRSGSTLVHKSCEETNPLGNNMDTNQKVCTNVTNGGIQSINCACGTDFCTDTIGGGGDIQLMAALLLAQESGVPIGRGENYFWII